jgi:hypothetical protein
MDTSKEYVKLCEKATEIQALRPLRSPIEESAWEEGDYLWAVKKPRWKGDLVDEDEIFIVGGDCVIPQRTSEGLELSTAGYAEGDSTPCKNIIWLPLQDQLQEMVAFEPFQIHKEYNLHSFIWFCEWGYGANITVKQPKDINSSLEQLWLSFVMKVKYGKNWNGEDWIKA